MVPIKLKKANVAISLLGFFNASVEFEPTASTTDELNRLVDLLEGHRALYVPMAYDVPGYVCKSVRTLREKLGAFAPQTAFGREAVGIFRAACTDFQTTIENIDEFEHDIFYRDETDTRIGINDPDITKNLGAQFGQAFGELRAIVRTVLVTLRDKNRISLPPGLTRLVDQSV